MVRVIVGPGPRSLSLALALVFSSVSSSGGGQAAGKQDTPSSPPSISAEPARVEAVIAHQIDQSPTGRLGAYLELASRYRSGDLRPVEEIRRWLPSELDLAIDDLRRRGDAVSEAPHAPGEIAAHDIEAAILLHAHVAFLVLRRTSQAEANAHLTSAERLFTWLSARARARHADEAERIVLRIQPRDFYLGLAGSTLALWNLHSAEGFARKGLKQLPKDAELLLLSGCVQEAIATQRSLEGDSDGARRSRADAERLYRDALSADSEVVEARLRLGRVLLEQERVDEAELPLETVASGAGDRAQRYLAWLFLGRLHERRRRPEQAAHAYEQALALYPDAQAARLGLALVEDKQADAAAAHLTLLEGFTKPQQTDTARRDPWCEYPFGPRGLAQAALERLHDRVVAP